MSDMFNGFYQVMGYYPECSDDVESITCDKCREVVHELDLIWLTAEGFAPLEDEGINPEAYKKYDAVCHNCYNDSNIMTLKVKG